MEGGKSMEYQDPWDIKRATTNCPLCGEITICNFLCEDCGELYE
jgi:ribosomal protein L32